MNSSDNFSEKVDRFWRARAEKSSWFFNDHKSQMLQFDYQFLQARVKSGATVSDLGAGSGELISRLVEELAVEGVAVEPQQKLLKQTRSKSVSLINQKAENYMDALNGSNWADVFLLFGVINYLQMDSRKNLYKNISRNLNPKGTLFIKSQMGIKSDIFVETKVGDDNYSACYPDFKKEQKILEEIGFNVDLHKFYPEEFNKHKNTRFFIYECSL